jgi:uncharacterized protein (TIGR00369 family)
VPPNLPHLIRWSHRRGFDASLEHGRGLLKCLGGFILDPAESKTVTPGGNAGLLELLGVRPLLLEAGRSQVQVVVSSQHLRSHGIAHGGIYATLLDTSMGWAAGSRAPDGWNVVTVQLNVNFIRPAKLGETLIARGEVQHSGRRTAVAYGEIKTADGHLVATGSATFMYVHIDPVQGTTT